MTIKTPPSTNPLDNINITELVSKDCEEWTDEDLENMIAYFRANRDRFEAKPAKKEKPTAVDIDKLLKTNFD